MERHTYDVTSLRNGGYDPTTRVWDARIERATLTPDGPGCIAIDIDADGQHTAQAWGPGAAWLTARAPRLTGRSTDFRPVLPHHDVLLRAVRDVGQLHLPASDTPYHELLPAVLGQRVTAQQALGQWAILCRRYGEPAPGPLGLRLPPTPERLRRIPSWEFHRLGIEEQRARGLLVVARYARFIDRVRECDGAAARSAIVSLPCIGEWTAAVAIGVSHGDPDALPVGDFHVKNTVAWALTGRARGTDTEMRQTLAPYAGQRWQVVRTLEKSGLGAPKFAPRRRNLDIARL